MDRQQNQTITLPDGQNLGYADYGHPNGKVFFFFPASQETACPLMIHQQPDAGHFGFLTAWGRICQLMHEPASG